MRLRLLAAATAMLASSLAAHADTLFTFTPDGGSSSTFHLAAQNYASDGYVAEYLTDNPEIDLVDFYDDQYGDSVQQAGFGHLDLWVAFHGAAFFLDGPQLFTGPESAPVFTLGTYNLTSAPGIGRGNATLVISDDSVASTPVATAATPEPSSLALLGTGLLGLAGAVRRRLA